MRTLALAQTFFIYSLNTRGVVLTSVREFLRSTRRSLPKQPSSTKPPLNQAEIRDQDRCQEPMVFLGLCHRRNPRSLNEYLVILLNVLVCCHLFVLLLRLNVDSEVLLSHNLRQR